MCCDEEIKDYNGNYTYIGFATDSEGSNFSLIKKDVNFDREFMSIYTSKMELNEEPNELKKFMLGRFFYAPSKKP